MVTNKKGAMELSIGAIVVLVLAITFLSLGIVFMKTMLGKMFLRLDEQISQEPEPLKPTLSRFITLSRNPIKTKEGIVEVIKISILNPSDKDWVNRQFVRARGMCGKIDGICFIDTNDQTEKCNTENSAKKNDPDCETGLFTGMDCSENSKNSPCLISNIFEEDETGGGNLYCPKEPGKANDPNCNPKEGIEVYLICDEKIMEQAFRRNIGSIEKGNHKTNILLLRLRSNIPDGQYLCQIRLFAEDEEYMEDLVVRIENE